MYDSDNNSFVEMMGFSTHGCYPAGKLHESYGLLGYVRWDAGQTLYKKTLMALYAACMASNEGTIRERCLAAGGLPDRLVDAFKAVWTDPAADGRFVALAADLPAPSELLNEIDETDPVTLHRVYEFVMFELASKVKDVLLEVVKKNDSDPGEHNRCKIC